MLPILYQSGNLKIFSYPLLMGMAWGFGYQYSRYLVIKNQLNINKFRGLFWGNFISVWLMAKIFFIYFSRNGEFDTYTQSLSFWFGGGFVFYGGLVGGVIFTLFYTKVLKMFSLKDCSLFLPVLCFAHAIGRIGCLLAGCCFGKETDLFWGIAHYHKIVHPVQAYETIYLALLGLILIFLQKKMKSYSILLVYFFSYSFGRFFLEYLRGDKIRGIHLFGLSSSQYVSFFVMLISTLVLLMIYLNQKIFKKRMK